MMGKILLLLVIYTAIWKADVSKLKQLGGREITAYTALLLLSVYLGIDYVMDLKWPFIEEAANFFLSKPAERIVKLLKVPS
ncbi:hypothetical protein [Cohnella sp.]|uniref:hypothetical protein n=1 Tax=Cohnella sp. TaxID=1883426 RepID=UPI003569E6C4